MLAAAWGGAALFLASLAYFAYFYLVRLGHAADVPADEVPAAIAINVALFSAFALHHSLFARTGAKAWLARVQVNGVLYATGNITVTGKSKVYGAVVSGGTIAGTDSRSTLEVWYDHDLGQGWLRGLPVVYRAPGTWLAKY